MASIRPPWVTTRTEPEPTRSTRAVEGAWARCSNSWMVSPTFPNLHGLSAADRLEEVGMLAGDLLEGAPFPVPQVHLPPHGIRLDG
jgi:hypothetical protein